MDDVSWIILGLLVVIGLPAMAISAFVMVIRLKRRVAVLEGQVERLAAGAGRGIEAPPPSLAPEPLRPPEPSQPSERAQDGATPLPPPPEPVPEPSEPVGEPEPGPIPELAAASAPADVPQRPRASLEETLGARWAVWVGGLALALGGIFLVRYSIESGLLGPGARVVMGFLFGCGLVALGEVLRRRGPGEGAQPGAAYIPGIVTAAGTAALFATVYAAHALYGFIGPGPAFVLLGLVGIATMAAAALHGPGLAGLGLVGSYAVPLLVSSNEPNPWALTLYLIVVTAAALALARLRMWRWLAIAASVGSLGWGVVAVVAMAEQDPLAIGVYCLALALLTSLFLVVDPHRGREASGFDPLALLVMSGVAALVSLFAATLDVSTLALLVALAVAAGLLASALAFDAVAPATALAALVVLAVLIAWPLASSIAAEPVLIAPDMSFPPLTPVSLISFVAVAVLCAGALFAATTLDHLRRPGRAVPAATALALGAVGGALLILACAYVRGTNFTANIPFAACALALPASSRRRPVVCSSSAMPAARHRLPPVRSMRRARLRPWRSP